jgi:arylsulfatase A-like enzyme
MRAILLVTVAILLAAAPLAAAERPNIVVLLADDLGYADLSVHGGKQIQTPHVDSLAAGGIRCTSGYVSCPYCSPTRAGFLTGRYQERFGHEFNPALVKNGGQGQGLAVNQATIAGLLQSAGYRTALIGKWHQGEEEPFHPLNRGFTDFFGFLPGAHSYLTSDDANFGPIFRGRERVALDGYLTDVLAREATEFIDRNKSNPFFIYLAFNAVHTPMEAPPRLLKQFEHVQDENRRTYLAMLAGLDEAVGQVLSKLRTAGLEENTLVFFFSDNGGPMGKFSSNGSQNDPLRGSKGDTWEGGIRVPFLIQWKGRLPAGKTYDHPVIALDILPTALAAAASEPALKFPLDGVNLLPHLTGKSTSPPHDLLYWRFGPQMAIRQGDWKLVRPSLGKREYVDVPEKPMLFNLSADIGERNDLAAQHPDRVAALQVAWDKWNATLPGPTWPATLKGKPIEFK